MHTQQPGVAATPKPLRRLVPLIGSLSAFVAVLESAYKEQLREERIFTLIFIAIAAMCIFAGARGLAIGRFGRRQARSFILHAAISIALISWAAYSLCTATIGAKDALW
jgi:hypothetical protein